MTNILDFPIAVFVISLAVFWVSIWIGFRLAIRLREAEDKDRDDLNLTTNASLTLLALIIGFSFSTALGRYDQRKNYEEEEANAIGTEYLRADLLSTADAARVRALMVEYLDQRVLFYTIRDQEKLESVSKETTRLENEMWSIVQTAANSKPTAPMILLVSGMNDVLNRAGYTQAAWWYRVPIGAWFTMAMLSVGCCLIIGFSAHRKRFLMTAFPFLVAVSFFFIADIDSPRTGLIRVIPYNLISLSESLRAQ